MRLIDADKLGMYLADWQFAIRGIDDEAADLIEEVIKILDGQPTIEAELVKHGRWLPQMLLGERVWDCSECKTIGSPAWKRCPVCEAKMEGEREET